MSADAVVITTRSSSKSDDRLKAARIPAAGTQTASPKAAEVHVPFDPAPKVKTESRTADNARIWDGDTWFRSILHFWVQPAFPTTQRLERTHKETFLTALHKPACRCFGTEGVTVASTCTQSGHRHTRPQTFSCDRDSDIVSYSGEGSVESETEEEEKNERERPSPTKNNCTRRTFPGPARDTRAVCFTSIGHGFPTTPLTQPTQAGSVGDGTHDNTTNNNDDIFSDGPERGNTISPPTTTTTPDTSVATTTFQAVRKRRNQNRLRRREHLNRDGSGETYGDLPVSEAACAVTDREACPPDRSTTAEPGKSVVCTAAKGRQPDSVDLCAPGRILGGDTCTQTSDLLVEGVACHSGEGVDQYNCTQGAAVCCAPSPINTVIFSTNSVNTTTCGVVSLVIKDTHKIVDLGSLYELPSHDSKGPYVSPPLESESVGVFQTVLHRSMIPVEVSESVAIVKVPRYAEYSVESRVEYCDMRRHKHEVKFEPTLAPVRFADTMIVYGKNNTRKRYVSRTFYEPRVKPKRFADTDFVFPKDKQQKYAAFVDYHIDECRKWFKTCMELKAKTFTTVHMLAGQETATRSVTSSRDVSGVRHDVTLRASPGASQVFIPPRKPGDVQLAERKFRVALDGKDKMDINMNGPLVNGF